MREQLGSLVGLATRLIDELEDSDLPYALGGALALMVWGEPRTTRDIDLTIFVEERRFLEAVQFFAARDVVLDEVAALSSARVDGLFAGMSREGYRVDVFVPSIPFYDSARERRRRVVVFEREASVLDAESLCVFKMLFFRSKDLADIERLIALRSALDDFDPIFVRNALIEVVGEDDERIERWDALVREFTDTA